MIPSYPRGVSDGLDLGPYRSAPATGGMSCPRCEGVRLSRRSVQYVGVDDCPRCGGAFLSARAFEAMCADAGLYELVREAYPPAPLGNPPGPMYLKCPDCRDVMNRRLFAEGSRVVLDVCRAHGTWLDRGELRAVIEFVATGGFAEERLRATRRRFEEARAADDAVRAVAQPARPRGRIAQAFLDLLTFWV